MIISIEIIKQDKKQYYFKYKLEISRNRKTFSGIFTSSNDADYIRKHLKLFGNNVLNVSFFNEKSSYEFENDLNKIINHITSDSKFTYETLKSIKRIKITLTIERFQMKHLK